MLSLVLMVAGLFIKAFSIWLRMQDSSIKMNNENETDEIVPDNQMVNKFF
jgi:hypothetical protein